MPRPPRPSARLPAAGTVVTLMKTPTIGWRSSVARASAPAAPATSATMNDHRSGCQMKPVFGRGRRHHVGGDQAGQAAPTQRRAASPRRSRTAKPGPAAAGSGRPAPSGRSTMPGGDRRDGAELRPDDHRADHQHRGVGDHRDRGEQHGEHQEDVVGHGRHGCRRPPARSTASQIDRVVGVPGAAASSRRAAANGVPVGVVTTMPPASSSPSSLSRASTSPACSRATSHSTRSPTGRQRGAAAAR